MLFTIAMALAADPFVLRGAALTGGRVVDIVVEDGLITSMNTTSPPDLRGFDAEGHFLAPGFIDSHVHLTFWPVHDALAASGVVAAVDLAAPIDSLKRPPSSLRLVASGPMVTAAGGYPTRSWGSDGYGVECTTPAEAVAAVDALKLAGAGVIKIPLNGTPELSEEALKAAVSRAHHHGLKVVTHAMDDRAVRLAAAVGMDALAHTPTGTLSDAAVSAWKGKAVISTLAAFGSSDLAVSNLRRLKEAGAIVLYGTDLGNSRTPRIDPAELALLASAGLTGTEILAAGTSTPAAWWGLEPLGTLAVGRPASLLVLKADPTKDPSTLSNPAQVYIDGMRR